jgi:methylthioxylose transferase
MAVAAPPILRSAPPRARAAPPRRRAERRAVVAWVVVVAVALAWGTAAVAGAGVALRAAPVMGRWHRPELGRGVLPAAALAAVVVAVGPGIARRLSWRAVPPAAAVGAAGWAVALAAAGGWGRVTEPLTTRHEYEPAAARIGDVGAFLSGYVADLGQWPVHVQGHPPGPVVLAWALDRVGLGGAGWLALVVLVAWGGAAAAALVAVREVAGEATARRAAPALVLLPAAVWAGTSVDALFAGIAATAVALAALAGRRGSAGWALAAGAVLGVGLLFTYGMALIGAVAVAVVWLATSPDLAARTPDMRRICRQIIIGASLPLALAAAAGFWWPAGLAATGAAYWSGIAGERPGVYLTLAGNPGALALATGPAVAAGLAGAWSRRGAVLRIAGPAAAAVLLADVSQMARGEVERIWLIFVPLLAVAAPGHRRAWLAAQAGLALVLQATLASPW